jgi:hypothetical protein
MAKFIVYHTLPTPTPIPAAEPVGKATKKYSTPEAYWVGAWIQLDEQGHATKICCEWDAKDVESIQRVLDKVLLEIPGFPVDGPYPLMKVDSEVYR